MNLTEHTFDELSALKYRIFTTPLPNALDREVLIVAFEGEYGVGCKGNEDAVAAFENVWQQHDFAG